ncbi:ABC transporter permease [Acidobacteria bacterium AB60]|nr:ABC transporter permease [Acidobacteria bacterium AB60]
MPAFITTVPTITRKLSKSPGFTVAAVLILALGIGATTAIFSLVEGVLLRPLPFRDPDRIVQLGEHVGDNPGIGARAADIPAYSAQTAAFSSVGGYANVSFEVSGGATPEVVNATRMTAGAFTTLAVQPAVGRLFTAEEEDAGKALAVISDALWQNRYHRDPRIVGTSVSLDRKTFTIIGVMPRSFEFPLQPGRLNRTELWIPMSLSGGELSIQNAGVWGYQMIARLKDGVTEQQAREDAGRVAQDIKRNFPTGMAAIRIRGDVNLLREATVANAKPLLRILFVAVTIVLLIACANVAGLMLVRAIRLRREYALRRALGANSRVLVRDSICEGLIISLAGGVLGLAFAAFVVRLALHVLPETMPRIDAISIDAGAALFALLLSLLTGTLCSLAPAFAAMRTNLSQSLNEGTRTSSGAADYSWLRSALVVAEIAIALLLLNLAGAFLRSFQKMRAVDPGFRADHALVAGYQLPRNVYPTNTTALTFSRNLIDHLASKPGITAAGITNNLPAAGSFAMAAYTIEGEPEEGWKLKFAPFGIIYGEYFAAMGIRLVEGRTFTPADKADSPLVIIVNESMARDCWPGQSPLGKRMHVGNPRKGLPWATVVGIVADTKSGALDEPTRDQWYAPLQQPAILVGRNAPDTLSRAAGGFIAVRSVLPSESLIETLRSSVAEIDPALALNPVQPMTEVVANVEAPRRFNTDLITSFALGALLLAAAGIYTVIAFSVSLRVQEIAIRMAMGAQRRNIARLILFSAAKMALLGCGLGLAASFAVARFVRSFLFEVSPTDTGIYALGAGFMILLALLASALPASRAASTDPIEILRSA